MKYKLDIEIDLPRKRVIELFDDLDNIEKWQPCLISFEHLSGTPADAKRRSADLGVRHIIN